MRVSPLVHVLVLNWNGRSHLEDCLPSLIETRFPQYRVVVLDNGSADDSCSWVRQHFPRVQLTRFERNLGFAGAYNFGIRASMAAGAEYVALLNNDTRVEPDWLNPLVQAAEERPDVAICSALQRGWEGDHEIRFRFVPEWAEAELDRVPLNSLIAAEATPFASGCGMLIRCSALKEVGLFDDRYFAYVEDVDLCLRAWLFGYVVLQVPQAIVYHKGSASSSSRQRMFWGYRNQLTTLLKLYQLSTLHTFRRSIARRWLWTRNRIALRATVSSLAMLPGTLMRRMRIQSRRVRTDAAFLSLCSR